MLFCPKCGKEIREDSTFCSYCGEPVQAGNHEESQSTGVSLEGPLAPSTLVSGVVNGQPAKPDRVARKGLSRGTNHVWYYEVHGFVYGPTSADDIYCRILDGRLTPGVNVWVQGSYNWGPAMDNVFFGSEGPDAQQVAEEDALPESNTLPPMTSRNGATTYTYYGGAAGENPRATNEPPYPAVSHGLTPFDETPMKQDSQATGGKAIKGCLTFVIACIVIYFLFFRGCATMLTTTPSSTPQTPTTTTVPVVTKTLSLKVTEATYDEYGYLKITGVLTNTCSASIYSPSIKLEVWSSDNTVLLASDTSWATGAMLENFLPGSSAAIDFFTSVSGAPQHIKWVLKCDDASLTVVHAEK